MATRFLINQCQIITFLILKYDIIENSRIELRGIVLPVQMGGLLEGGGAKGMLAPPLKLLGGPAPPLPPPPPPPSSYAYGYHYQNFQKSVLMYVSVVCTCRKVFFLVEQLNITTTVMLHDVLMPQAQLFINSEKCTELYKPATFHTI